MASKSANSKQAKAEQVERLRTVLSHASQSHTLLTVAGLASQAELDPQATLTLLAGKPLKDDVILVGKHVDSPVAMKSEVDRLCASDLVAPYLAERVQELRLAQNQPPRQMLPAFLKDAKLPAAIKPKLTARIKQQMSDGALPAVLLGVIQPPPTSVEIAEQLLQRLRDARDRSHYPLLKSELVSVKGLNATATQISAAMKLPQFADHAAPSTALGTTAATASFVLQQDIDQATAALVLLAIEVAIQTSQKRKGNSPGKPSTVFTAKKVAAAILRPRPLQDRFVSGLQRQSENESLMDELATLMLDGVRVYFRRQDVFPSMARAVSTSPVRETLSNEPPVNETPVNSNVAAELDFEAEFDAAFARIDARSGGRNYVKLVDLRDSLPQFPRSRFDDELRRLRVADRYDMDSAHGGFITLSEAERAAGIHEGSSLLIYVSRK